MDEDCCSGYALFSVRRNSIPRDHCNRFHFNDFLVPMSHPGQSRRPEVRRTFPVFPGGLNGSMQHFILEGKDGVRNGAKIS
jgi:hypothetical protein